mmetsp:Transcript_80951/g.237983  ORF Transcript_80951/g.237983 Transcript_80951/m.237983 type:complete len:392 (-) Transcript_80951:132-1307(-)
MDLTKAFAVLALLVFSLFIYEWAVQNDLSSPLLADTTPALRLCCYLLLLLVALAFFAYDWLELGPTLALKRGVLATMVAWLLIVPLGVVSELFIHSAWFVAVLAAGILGAGLAFRALGNIFGFVAGAVIFVFSWMLATHQEHFQSIEHVVGAVLMFVSASWAVRVVTNVAAESFAPVGSWEGVTRVDKDSQEFREQQDLFEAGVAAYADKYNWWLYVADLYRVDPSIGCKAPGGLLRTADGKALFHGTRRESAQGIISDGFRLPKHPGMFGKGIYFAACPSKSWQYTDGMMNFRKGLILMCWVELGRASHQKSACNNLTRPPRRSFMQWLKSEERYTSVVGDDKDAGGALRVPEFVIYDTDKVQVDYICEVECVPKGTGRPTAPGLSNLNA